MWTVKEIMHHIKNAVDFLVTRTNETNFAVFFLYCVSICERKLLRA